MTLLNGELTYTFGTCFNITDMIISPPIFLFNKVEIGKARLDISMQDSYVYAWMKIPITDFWKSFIIRGVKKVVESKLQGFITAQS
ncbi:hypothetical protein TcWFU_006909 [Taenia crassiceps]|uniref:Uncharacterized protein n=1 Tax=Taenia crassiceps TaxID=6207 RepID=A0ABR4QB73_9CEST